MIQTEQQRRWWFATHPEFSSSEARRKSIIYGDDYDGDGKPSPESVDALMDGLIKQVKDGFWIDVFSEVKSRYGTEEAWKRDAQNYALLGHDEQSDSQDDQTEKGSFGSAYGWAKDNWEDALRALRDYLIGIGPAVISPTQANHPSTDEMAKRLGTTRDDFHTRIKKEIARDFSSELKRIGNPENLDIGIDPKGNIVLRNRKTRREINTGVPLATYAK